MIARILLTGLAYIASLVVIAVIAFFLVIFLAGWHGGILPYWFEKPVLLLGWSAVLVLPVLIARRVWCWEFSVQAKTQD
ncbi:MAG: hypothetical protein ACU836_12470 [Gammaproteobacteria bacterium]